LQLLLTRLFESIDRYTKRVTGSRGTGANEHQGNAADTIAVVIISKLPFYMFFISVSFALKRALAENFSICKINDLILFEQIYSQISYLHPSMRQ